MLPRSSLLQRQPQETDVGRFGKVRTVAHVDGNWSGYVYLELQDTADLTKLSDKMKTEFNLESVDNFRISLSRQFYIKHFQIDSFLSVLRHHIKDVAIPKRIKLDGLKVFNNDERTRWFVSALVDDEGSKDLLLLTKAVDSALGLFGLPSFYTVHISSFT